MLTIRNEQMDAFRRDAVQQFSAKLEKLIAHHTGAPETAAAAAQSAIETAHGFHIRRECDIANLVQIACSHAIPFPLPPLPRQVKAVMWDYSRPVDEKLEYFRTWAAPNVR